MKIVSWNIYWGGGKRCSAIAAALISTGADVIVLPEYQQQISDPLLLALSEAGWTEQLLTAPPLKFGGVAIASRVPLTSRPAPAPFERFPHRYVCCRVNNHDLELRGVYAPLQNDPYEDFWTAMLDDLRATVSQPTLAIGDFNAGTPRLDSPVDKFFCSQFFEGLPACGYTDLWRHHAGDTAREYTWLGRANPYRLDHAFGTAGVVARLRRCHYDHSVRERRLSDHSLMTVELE